MISALLDTNVVSFILKEHALRFLYVPHLFDVDQYISFQTEAEIREGALRARWGVRKMEMLEADLQEFSVIQSSSDIIQQFAEIRAARKRQPISVADAWIAATAMAHDLRLVTHNPDDFAGIQGLKIITEKA